MTASRVPPSIEARVLGREVDEPLGISPIRLERRHLEVHGELVDGVLGPTLDEGRRRDRFPGAHAGESLGAAVDGVGEDPGRLEAGLERMVERLTAATLRPHRLTVELGTGDEGEMVVVRHTWM